MTMTKRRRIQWWIPLTILVVGSAISLSVGLGQRSGRAIVIGEVVTVVVAVVRMLLSAGTSDLGAVLGNRVDERQALIRLKASRVCAIVGVGGAIVAGVATAAIHETYWPYGVIYLVAGFSYLISLWVYGADREVPEGMTPPRDQID
jgi:uncharacterized membrane protein